MRYCNYLNRVTSWFADPTTRYRYLDKLPYIMAWCQPLMSSSPWSQFDLVSYFWFFSCSFCLSSLLTASSIFHRRQRQTNFAHTHLQNFGSSQRRIRWSNLPHSQVRIYPIYASCLTPNNFTCSSFSNSPSTYNCPHIAINLCTENDDYAPHILFVLVVGIPLSFELPQSWCFGDSNASRVSFEWRKDS